MASEYDCRVTLFLGVEKTLIRGCRKAQYNAWCHNNGNHSTPKRGHEDWNAKIIWKMRTELAYQWDLVEDEIVVVSDELLTRVKQLLADFRSMVQGKLRYRLPNGGRLAWRG